jgi:FMN phosphatase YigB (HAD superfamily)
VGHLKPHVRPFAAILERLEVEPEEAIFVGDRVYDDVVGAQSAGIRAVWIRRDPAATADSVRPNAIIDSLTALLPTLDMWFPGWR